MFCFLFTGSNFMKKYTAYKTIQLILFVAMTVAIVIVIFPNAGVYRQVAIDPVMKILAFTLWAALGISFLFIFLDYTFFFGYKKDYREMEYALHSDPSSGIANRFSCDMLIDQYAGKPLPSNMGCIMFDLTNIREINELYGHVSGNTAIRDFSNILRLASQDLCFIGRNGGNRFLAIFENASESDMRKLLDRVSQKVNTYNRDPATAQIEYAYGKAYSAKDTEATEITQLISLATSRIGK